VKTKSVSDLGENTAASFFNEKAGAPFPVKGEKYFSIKSNSDVVSVQSPLTAFFFRYFI